jgi:hypothetical protein
MTANSEIRQLSHRMWQITHTHVYPFYEYTPFCCSLTVFTFPFTFMKYFLGRDAGVYRKYTKQTNVNFAMLPQQWAADWGGLWSGARRLELRRCGKLLKGTFMMMCCQGLVREYLIREYENLTAFLELWILRMRSGWNRHRIVSSGRFCSLLLHR